MSSRIGLGGSILLHGLVLFAAITVELPLRDLPPWDEPTPIDLELVDDVPAAAAPLGIAKVLDTAPSPARAGSGEKRALSSPAPPRAKVLALAPGEAKQPARPLNSAPLAAPLLPPAGELQAAPTIAAETAARTTSAKVSALPPVPNAPASAAKQLGPSRPASASNRPPPVLAVEASAPSAAIGAGSAAGVAKRLGSARPASASSLPPPALAAKAQPPAESAAVALPAPSASAASAALGAGSATVAAHLAAIGPEGPVAAAPPIATAPASRPVKPASPALPISPAPQKLASLSSLPGETVGLLRPAPPGAGEPGTDPDAEIGSLVSALPCARVNAHLDPGSRQVALTGHVRTAGEAAELAREVAAVRGVTDVQSAGLLVVGEPYCGVLALLSRADMLQSKEQRAGLGDFAGPLPAATLHLSQGMPLDLQLRAPDFESYVYVDYFSSDGKVFHLLPRGDLGGALVPPGVRFGVGGDGDPGGRITVAPPFGLDMVVALGATRRLMPETRPASEDANGYLAALQRQIAEIRRKHPDLRVEYMYHLIFTSGPS